ncbi:basic proline-rich protein-like [Galendromus occidentalis]|uniref:Basic proline-rich protein-like n=1 Tax=Galendromus occidentalis TaxID=34638 RepID=A0AAJ7L792_9ACAR|nr:basic proline-rich protein-like [Galendromus occidentalis]
MGKVTIFIFLISLICVSKQWDLSETNSPQAGPGSPTEYSLDQTEQEPFFENRHPAHNSAEGHASEHNKFEIHHPGVAAFENTLPEPVPVDNHDHQDPDESGNHQSDPKSSGSPEPAQNDIESHQPPDPASIQAAGAPPLYYSGYWNPPTGVPGQIPPEAPLAAAAETQESPLADHDHNAMDAADHGFNLNGYAPQNAPVGVQPESPGSWDSPPPESVTSQGPHEGAALAPISSPPEQNAADQSAPSNQGTGLPGSVPDAPESWSSPGVSESPSSQVPAESHAMIPPSATPPDSPGTTGAAGTPSVIPLISGFPMVSGVTSSPSAPAQSGSPSLASLPAAGAPTDSVAQSNPGAPGVYSGGVSNPDAPPEPAAPQANPDAASDPNGLPVSPGAPSNPAAPTNPNVLPTNPGAPAFPAAPDNPGAPAQPGALTPFVSTGYPSLPAYPGVRFNPGLQPSSSSASMLPALSGLPMSSGSQSIPAIQAAPSTPIPVVASQNVPASIPPAVSTTLPTSSSSSSPTSAPSSVPKPYSHAHTAAQAQALEQARAQAQKQPQTVTQAPATAVECDNATAPKPPECVTPPTPPQCVPPQNTSCAPSTASPHECTTSPNSQSPECSMPEVVTPTSPVTTARPRPTERAKRHESSTVEPSKKAKESKVVTKLRAPWKAMKRIYPPRKQNAKKKTSLTERSKVNEQAPGQSPAPIIESTTTPMTPIDEEEIAHISHLDRTPKPGSYRMNTIYRSDGSASGNADQDSGRGPETDLPGGEEASETSPNVTPTSLVDNSTIPGSGPASRSMVIYGADDSSGTNALPAKTAPAVDHIALVPSADTAVPAQRGPNSPSSSLATAFADASMDRNIKIVPRQTHSKTSQISRTRIRKRIQAKIE